MAEIPSTDDLMPGWQALSTTGRLSETQAKLAETQDELSDTLGMMVDLLYALDAFQIESGADRNAAYATGIEAVRQLRQERDQAYAELDALKLSRAATDAELAAAYREIADLKAQAEIKARQHARTRGFLTTAAQDLSLTRAQLDDLIAELSHARAQVFSTEESE